MVQIQNKDTIKRINEDSGIRTLGQTFISELKTDVQPVLISNPMPLIQCKQILRVTTGATTILTTSTTKDTYLVGAFLTNTSDVTADNTGIQIVAKINDGTDTTILQFRKFSVTAFYDSKYISFPPMLLARGGTVTAGTAFTVGASATTGVIFFYEVEV